MFNFLKYMEKPFFPLLFFVSFGSGIRDWEKIGIRDKYPGSATLTASENPESNILSVGVDSP